MKTNDKIREEHQKLKHIASFFSERFDDANDTFELQKPEWKNSIPGLVARREKDALGHAVDGLLEAIMDLELAYDLD